jgi:hypothetical protein
MADMQPRPRRIELTTNPKVQVAIRAAHLRYRKNIGRHAAWQYAKSRGCPMGIYRLACQLTVLQDAGYPAKGA